MATHSSIIAWRIPWTEELGGLKSTGSQTDTTKRLTLHLVFFKNKNRSKENVMGWEYKLDTDGSFHTEMYFICIGSNRIRQKNRQFWLILACERVNPGVNVNFFFFFNHIDLFWASLGLCCCVGFALVAEGEAALRLPHASSSRRWLPLLCSVGCRALEPQ